MKILITGGAGYIGSALAERLDKLDEVEEIIVLDNLSRTPLSFFLGKESFKKVKFVKGDILDSYILDELIKQVDTVYHLAGFVLSPYNYAQNIQYEQINQWGTLNLVRCIQQSSHKIKHFVYLSSASVYGFKGEISLEDEPQPTNAYGISKYEGEKFVRLLKEECNVKIVRAGNVFGFNYGVRLDSVLNHFIFHGLIDKKILIYGDGGQRRPFVSLEKCVDTLIQCSTEKDSSLIHYAMQFNADLNEIKNWLIEYKIPELEFTYVNRNIVYDGQFIKGLGTISDNYELLNTTFEEFRNNLKIQAI